MYQVYQEFKNKEGQKGSNRLGNTEVIIALAKYSLKGLSQSQIGMG